MLHLQGEPSFSDFMRFDERNASHFETLASDEQTRREPEPSLEALMQEIDRLDQKLNLMTELACRSCAARSGRARASAVSFIERRSGFKYSEAESVNEGDWMKVSSFCSPMCLGRLSSQPEWSSNPDFVPNDWLTLSFEQVNEVVESALDRLVFKHHRREVAMRRANREENE